MPPRQDRLTDSAASARELITRPETFVPENPSELLQPANNLLVAMRRNNDLLSTARVGREKRRHTDSVVFSYLKDGKTLDAEAAAYFVEGERHAALQVSVDPDMGNRNMATYQIIDGIITCVGEVDDADIDEGTSTLVLRAINALQHQLTTTHDRLDSEKADRREKLARRSRVVGGTALAICIVVGGVGYGVKSWIIDPHKRSAAARAEFDKSDIQLPGEGVRVTQETVIGVPKKSLDIIPEFKDNDSLEDARRISITEENGCFEVESKLPDDSDVVIVAADHGPFEGSAYSIANSGKTFEVCLTNVVDGNSDTTDTSDVAIQVRTTN